MNKALDAELAALCALPRESLYHNAVEYFRHGGGTEPDVALVVYGNARAIFKDFGRIDGWFAHLLGPLLIYREVTALQQLDGIDGIPSLYKRIDRHGMLMEYVPAKPWGKSMPPDVSYERLGRLVEAMHGRGVAHGDMRSPSNVLVDKAGQPYLVDFVARVLRGSAWNIVWNWLFAKFCAADRSGVAKLKVRFAPGLASPGDALIAVHRKAGNRLVRSLGVLVRRLFRLFVRQRPGN